MIISIDEWFKKYGTPKVEVEEDIDLDSTDDVERWEEEQEEINEEEE